MKTWSKKLTRTQAIALIERATCRDDPFWENVVQNYYEEESDTMPTIFDVMEALGVTEQEYREATSQPPKDKT